MTSGVPSTVISPETALSPDLDTSMFFASLSLSLTWMSAKTTADLEMLALGVVRSLVLVLSSEHAPVLRLMIIYFCKKN